MPALKGAKLSFAEATLVLALRSFCVGLILFFSDQFGVVLSASKRSIQMYIVGFMWRSEESRHLPPLPFLT